ncbi:Big1p SCDLUD_003185 [Saccharomycodes ludwigii]|uniref:Big1p n=1 Tax=Saccharomycodes ludwigii TaxID=36035 RepID=UPI001E81EEF5|nr:hypothetical protein SCDLUD_003185 [Saccharomycodes ludwigii]KAH3900214.1 hypothetical protein SCDLUD_003185 [Saccharomycodes ludwigii]
MSNNIFNILLFFLAYSLSSQASKPGLIATFQLSPGLQLHSKAHDPIKELPQSEFLDIVKKSISFCNSDAYVFINQPNIRKDDFFKYGDKMENLMGYFEGSSSIAKFEKIQETIENQDIFEELIQFAIETCSIDQVFCIKGNDTDSYQPVYDIGTRIFRIDFPDLPYNDSILRMKYIEDFDKFIKYVIAQLPTPYRTIIYTSSMDDNRKNPPNYEIVPIEIFSSIFDDPSRKIEYERNNKILEGVNSGFRKYEPKFKEKYDYSMYPTTIFDKTYITENKELLQLIISTLACFIAFYYYFFSLRNKKKGIVTNKIKKLDTKKKKYKNSS